MNFDLICLDVDGTLCDRDSTAPYDYVIDTLASWSGKKVLITNQGGVGLRLWLQEMEEAGEEVDYQHLPTRQQARERIAQVALKLAVDMAYISLAYTSKSTGSWYPKKQDSTVYRQGYIKSSFSRNWRKPDTGMIDQAMSDFDIEDPKRVLVVGDRDEDLRAAAAMGCSFIWANRFFGVDK